MDLSELLVHIDLQLSSKASNEQRINSFKVLENYKNNQFNLKDLSYLCSGSSNSGSFLFGLQCLEYKIKTSWHNAEENFKSEIKRSLLHLSLEFPNLTRENVHSPLVVSVLSQILVHLMKCEWPQRWPSMIDELAKIGKSGLPQAQLVFSVLSRFVEDVTDFSNIPFERKKDLSHAIKECTPFLFSFIFELLDEILKKQISNAEAACREALVLTSHLVQYFPLDSMIKWTSDNISSPGRSLDIIITFLDHNKLRLEAADVLENIFFKNPEFCNILSAPEKLNDCSNILSRHLFNDTNPSQMFNKFCSIFDKELDSTEYSEDRKVFMLRCAKIFARLGQLMIECLTSLPHGSVNCACLTNTLININCRDWVSHLLHVLVKLTVFSIKEIAVESSEFWAHLFKNELSAINVRLEPILPQLFYSWKSTLSSWSDESMLSLKWMSYSHSFEESRHILMLIRSITLNKCFANLGSLKPELAAKLLVEWLLNTIKANIEISNENLVQEGFPFFKESHPICIEWEGLALVSNCLLNSIFISCKPKDSGVSEKEHYDQVMTLAKLQDFFATATRELFQFIQQQKYADLIADPKVRCYIVQVLITMVDHSGSRFDSEFLVSMLSQTFQALTYNPPGISDNSTSEILQENKILGQPRIVKESQVKVASYLLNFAKDDPCRLIKFYDPLFTEVSKIWQTDCCGLLPKCILLELVILLCLNLEDGYPRQLQLMRDMLSFAYEPWIQADSTFNIGAANSSELARLSGMTIPIGNIEQIDQNKECFNFRIDFTTNLETMLAITRRLESVKNKQQRETICLPLIEPIFLTVVKIIKSINELNTPAGHNYIHQSLHSIFDLHENQKKLLLGLPLDENDSNKRLELYNYKATSVQLLSGDCFRKFISVVYEKSFLLFAHCISSLGSKFHTLPLEQEKIIMHQACFNNFDQIPIWRLNMIIRNILKPFLNSCPKEYILSSVLPILSPILDALIQYISNLWSSVTIVKDQDQVVGDKIASEVLTEELVRILGRNTLDFLRCFLSFNGLEIKIPVEDVLDFEDNEISHQQQNQGKIGLVALIWFDSNDDQFWQLLSTSLPRVLLWPDSSVGLRCVNIISSLLDMILKKAQKSNRNSQFRNISTDCAKNLFTAVLYALQVYAQEAEPQLHTILCQIAVQVYQLVEKSIASNELRLIILDALQAVQTGDSEIPQKNLENIMNFENVIYNKVNETERRKRDCFKKLTQSIVGVPLCEKFKVKTRILNPPPINRYKSVAKLSNNITDTVLDGLEFLFSK